MSNVVASAFLLFSGLAIALPVAAAQPAAPVKLIARIPLANVSGRMDHMWVDVKSQRLFAAAYDNHTLEVVDLKAGRQVGTIKDLDEPQAAFYEAASNHLFVSSSGDGTVKMFDGSSLKLLKTVKLGEDADNIRYDAARHHVLVGYGGEKFLYGKPRRAQGNAAIAILDTNGNLVGQIPTESAHPESFRFIENRVFINLPDRKEIQVADLSSDKTIADWRATGCGSNFAMYADEPHHLVMVACRMPAALAVFDAETGKPVANVRLNPAIDSDDMFYDGRGGRAFVLGRVPLVQDPHDPAGGFLEVFQQIDTKHYEETASIPTGWGAQSGFFSPELGELIVATRRQDDVVTVPGEILVYDTK
jgi:hypothetical protein